MRLRDRLHPRSSSGTRLLAAAALWAGVGTGLAVAGLRWALAAPGTAVSLGLVASVAAGWAKGRFVLAPRARQNAERILAAGEGRCVGGVFSWPMWLAVAGFMALGVALRHSPLPRPVIGCLYVAVGVAMLVGAWTAWSMWRRSIPRMGSA